LREAAAYGNLQTRVFLLLLVENAKVAIELVVGVLTNSTGVENNDI
jgi:hypothetical protein